MLICNFHPAALIVYPHVNWAVCACSKCGPRLSPQAAEKLKNRYVLMRNSAADHEKESGKRTAIPITVRLALSPTALESVYTVAFSGYGIISASFCSASPFLQQFKKY